MYTFSDAEREGNSWNSAEASTQWCYAACVLLIFPVA